jgi:hypothetical protein
MEGLMELAKVWEVLDKHVDQKALSRDLVLLLVVPWLEKVVADTENKFDDAALGEIKKYIEKM